MNYSSANLNKYTTRSRLYRWHIEAFHAHLISLARSINPQTILDAGCGEGHLSAAIKHKIPGADITGVDYSHEAVAYAQNAFPDAASFSRANVFELPFEDNSFDLVVCSQVLEHLEDPAPAVEELMRVASHAILISVPLEPYFKFFNDISRALGVSPDPGHVQFWTKKSFPRYFDRFFEAAEYSTLHYYQALLATLSPT